MGFQYSVENVVNHLTINGMTAIPDEIRSIEELEGMSWNLKPPEKTSVRVPSRVAVNERINRSVSLRFERYPADDAESSTSYQPLPDAIMGPAVYPPARQNLQQAYKPDYQFGYPQGKGNTFYGGYGYYKNNRKKYGIRKSRTYKGKPHNSHVKPFKRKYKDDRGRVKKCKCFICGKEGHFAKDCRSKQGNITRSAVYQELDLDDNWDIISADFNDSSVYIISEVEGDVHQNIGIMVQDTPIEEAAFMAIEKSDDEQDIEEEYDSLHAFMFHPGPPTKIADMVQSAGSWKPDKELPTQSKSYEHDWKENAVQQMIKDQAKEYYKGKIAIKEKEELWQTERSLLVRDLTDALKIID
nr:retrovirus-related Pol poly from transposon TNT 1-94 isoform A [Tanacetum cinerariifolium]